mmetsp:Transcript_20714/g.33501  ORF Transcript_20714/g.33501 Transcript_20714/m.33501 type:complete len:509 (+) Transcript_20714:26-1552(+)
MLPLENRTHLTAPTSALLAGLPSIVDLAQCKDVNDTFSDLRAWIRRTSSQAGLSAAGQLLSFEQREAVLNFLERLTLDPLRKNLARELLVKLNMDEIWRSGSVHGRRITEGVPQELRGTLAPGRSASVSAARMSSDPIRHRLAEDLTEKLASPTDSAILRSSITFPRAHHTVGMCRLGMHNDPITVLFCVPRTCHHVVVGKHGEDVGKLEEKHAVKIRVPKLEEESEVIAVSGLPDSVEQCRQTLESLLQLPVGTEPLHQMVLGVPRASYGLIIGERGATLHAIMLSSKVLLEVPKADVPGDVTVRGRVDGCLHAKMKIEEILRDAIPVLASGTCEKHAMPLPPAYDLAVDKPIQKCLFFPEEGGQSSDDGLTSLGTLLKFLDSTRLTCDACVFTITDNRIARRLLDAHRYRKVKVRVITDKVQSEALGSDIGELQAAGIEVRMNTSPYHMHHKFCILDGLVLLNGSFNWTQGACENNCENVMISNDKAFLSPFKAQFERLWQEYAHS